MPVMVVIFMELCNFLKILEILLFNNSLMHVSNYQRNYNK